VGRLCANAQGLNQNQANNSKLSHFLHEQANVFLEDKLPNKIISALFQLLENPEHSSGSSFEFMRFSS
jgi:hypothetical protein